jgi:hypothetical protein
MQVFEQISIVKETVKAYLEKYPYRIESLSKEELDHVLNIGTSIMCTKWNIGYPSGGFVEAVVENNLMAAVGRADSTNIKALPFYCQMMYNVGMPSELVEYAH